MRIFTFYPLVFYTHTTWWREKKKREETTLVPQKKNSRHTLSHEDTIIQLVLF